MNTVATKVAVVGSGIAGSVCASSLAKNGVSVTLFESARGPGGRMSQRREVSEDGKELVFDHGAPFFTVNNAEVLGLVREWESRGLVAEWKQRLTKRYVGVPGMNAICKALCQEPGVERKFGVGVGRMEWLESENLWSLTGLDGQNLGQFQGVVASDKNIVSPRFTSVTGRPPPLAKLQDIPVIPCFALMLAFAEPLSAIPIKGFTMINSEVLSWAHCDSSKPGRSAASERWVLHSTMEYANSVIAQTGLQKLSEATLKKVAEEIFHEFQSTGLSISQPFFKKAHRCCSFWKRLVPGFQLRFWRGSAFPATSIAKEEKCLWEKNKRLAIAGDFCVSPNIEGAIVSGIAAASKLTEMLSCL
ncbi:protoporphyrinogen oxidase 2 [Quercus suber]|uniref:Protoporphyrinogen oxidase 2 n=1 Tax=Quercus suber TaxID=58331 RepID=A0AAW0LDF1_QUESU